MNWSITRANNCNELCPPKMMSRNRSLKKDTLFRIASKCEVSCLNQVQSLEWGRQNTPQEISSNGTSTSLGTIRRAATGGQRMRMSSHRRHSEENERALALSAHEIPSRLHDHRVIEHHIQTVECRA